MTRQQIRRGVWCASVLVAMLGLADAQAEPQKGKAQRMTVEAGKQISLEYTLRLDDKTVVDTNVGRDPLTYTQGQQQIIPGLESALTGMAVGESKNVTVAPNDGYGVVNPQAFQEVPKENIPSEALKVGTQLQGKDSSGRIVRPRVSAVNKDTVVLDFNHPLAGQTLHFDVKVVDIK